MRDSLGIELAGNELRYVLISGGRVTKAEAFSNLPFDEAISAIKDETGWEKAWLTVALPEFHARKLPFKPDPDIVSFYMQFQDTGDYRWQVRGEYFAFAPKHAINLNYDLLAHNGITPLAVEISGFSVVRTFMENYHELSDDNLVLVYLTPVVNFITFLKNGELALSVSRPPSEKSELIISTILSLADVAFNAANFALFAGGEIESARDLLQAMNNATPKVSTDLINPFRKVKAINMSQEKANKFIGALGVALRS